MIKTIYVKLVLIFICIFIFGNIASFFITALTSEENLIHDITNSLVKASNAAKDVYEKGGTKAEDIEKLYASGFISVRFYDDLDKLKKDYSFLDESLPAIENTSVILYEEDIDKHDRKIPISVVKSGDVYIAATLDAQNVFPDLRTLILKSNICSLLFGSAVMLIVARFIIKPVKTLSMATEKISKGDFEVQVEKKRNDEIGQLINNFNTMAKELAGMEMLRNNFISDISHEFKTPLTSIEGYSKLLRDCKSDEEQNEYIDIIMEETKRLSALSGNILLLNRIENENITLTKKLFRLDEQIRHVILLCESKWSVKNINLHIDLKEMNYYGNEQLLYQVWLNLFDNAVKFSKIGDEIEISLNKSDDKTVFSITDFGKGMTEEEQKRMFEKFYTGDPSRNTEGTGLGLSIVKRIIDMHCGKIEVLSKLDEFTQIKVIL